MILAFKESLHKYTYISSCQQVTDCQLWAQDLRSWRNFQSYKFLPLVNQTAPRMISKYSPGPNSLDIDLTMVMGK